MWLIGSDGKLLFQQVFHNKEILRSSPAWHPSADGRRFAIAVMKVKGGNEFLDIGGHASLDRIMVFDIARQRWIYTLDAKSHKITGISAMAVSPDGSLVGLITQEGILEAYRVP
jgi:hypothetical protein